MTSEKQIEANRRNAQKSTGPKTEAGKGASRINALKHGLRADTLDVLFNEDPTAFEARLDSWIEDYQPRGEREEHLVRRAAVLSWKLDRAERHEAAYLSGRVREAIAGAEQAAHERLEDAYKKLLPNVFEYHEQYVRGGPDGQNLRWLREDVEATAQGCRWLLEDWTAMLRQVQEGRAWTPPQEFQAIRLLVRGPEPRITDPQVLDVVVANRIYDSRNVAVTPENFFVGLGVSYSESAVARAFERRPEGRAGAAAVLLAVASREIERLQALLAEREKDGELGAEVGQAGLLAMFDPGPEGEQLRRYQFTIERELRRTLETLARLRRDEAKPKKDEARRPPIVADGPIAAARDAGLDEAGGGDDLSSGSPVAPAPIEPISGPDVQVLFAPDRERSVEPIRPAAPTHTAPPAGPSRPMSNRQRALARMAKRARSGG